MHRASNAFSVLQATAVVVCLATLLWSLGIPSIRFAEAANVTSFSDTLSDSTPGDSADHTIEFNSPTGIGNNQAIVINFPAGSFDTSAITNNDVDLLENGVHELVGTTWDVSTSTNSVTITSQGAFGIAADATTTIRIGLNATRGGLDTPVNQIVNPVAGSYEINLDAGSSDTGSTRVAIVADVTVTASVDTVFEFTVAGVNAGVNVNGTTTTGATTATEIPFGELEAGVASTAAQELSVTTNASNGFVVTVIADSQLDSPSGADIDGFANGEYWDTPQDWEAPTPALGDEWTYGHWGVSTNDPTLSETLTDVFGAGQYVSASTTPVEVFRHDGPANGAITGSGVVLVGYTVQTSVLQEAANDYSATLTYVATPVF